MQTMQAKQTMLEEYTLTVSEAAALLGETEKAIQRLIYTAKLDAIRIKGRRGHEFRVRPSEVLAQKARLPQTSEPVEPGPSLPQTSEPVEPGPSLPADDGSDWASVYHDLFLRYDQLGRRTVRLERENRRLRDVLAQFSRRPSAASHS